jgi:hypothetical protein
MNTLDQPGEKVKEKTKVSARLGKKPKWLRFYIAGAMR